MYFSKIICDEPLYQEARWFFLQQWRSDLLYREPSSLIGAYMITQQMFKLWKTWFSFKDWVFSYEELYYSTAHSWDLLMVIIDTKRVAVDVEYVLPRDESLLQNVHIPESSFSPRENFYLQRCSKECLTKFLSLNSDEMQEMEVSSFIWNQHFSINERKFEYLSIIHYKWKEYPIHLNINNWIVSAILQEDNNPDTVY